MSPVRLVWLPAQRMSSEVNNAAAFGVNAGTPWGQGGNTLPLNNFLDNIGLSSEELSQKGVTDYLSFLSGVGATQTDPNLAVNVATQNAVDAAAPNPQLAAQQQLTDMEQWYNFTNPKPPTPTSNTPAAAVASGGTGTWWTPAGTNQFIPGRPPT
jgi:hypothetical protein